MVCLKGDDIGFVSLEDVIGKEKYTMQPPKLYDLTTLQRDANRLFGFTAKQTLEYTQNLYEKKLVTYPRTDSQYLSDDMEQTELLIYVNTLTDILRGRTPRCSRSKYLPKMSQP